MKFILTVCFIAIGLSESNAQDSPKAIGSISDPQKKYALVLNGLKLFSDRNIVKAISTVKQSEIEQTDTLSYTEARTKYNSLVLGFDGVIELSVKLPFILNKLLLKTKHEKDQHLRKVCDSSIVDIKYVTRKKGKSITGSDPLQGCIWLITAENVKCQD